MDIIVVVNNEVDKRWFLHGEKYVGTYTQKADPCSECPDMLKGYYTVTIDTIDYDIPEEYIVEDDGFTFVDPRHPLQVWQDRTDIPWPGEEPIHDYDKAYIEYMGIDLEADPFVKRYKPVTPDDPGKNTVEG